MNRLVDGNERISFHVPFTMDREFLNRHGNVLFIFGDNSRHFGKGGAAKLRDRPNAIGFVTKKYPSNEDSSFFTLNDYSEVF